MFPTAAEITKENKKVKIQVLNLESKYEEINNEILSQRYYPK